MATSTLDPTRASPSSRKPKWRLFAIRWHQLLALFGGVALLLWGLSGLLHPIITAFGPQQAVFFPPERPVDLQGARSIAETLKVAGIGQAAAVKVIVGETENLLQVTESQDAPRRYFRLADGAELPGHDRVHAIWLARHYSGELDAPVRSAERVTDFSEDYPAVNRLLPVYRVQFERPDNLALHIYTETNAVAAVGNDFKAGLQQWFQWVHTWSWMPREAEWARVALMAALVGSLFALAVTGTMMLVLIRRKVRALGTRGWHRIAGYALALPLLMFSSSGLFHLLQNGWDEPQRTLALSPPIAIPANGSALTETWSDLSRGLNVNGVSLVAAQDGTLLYRLSLAPDRKGGPVTGTAIRNARFDGAARTGPALYVEAATGQAWKPGDRELALQMGERFTGVGRDAITNAGLVTRFGPAYDFRNKRLPVWQLDYGHPVNATIFVDTATGVLADRTADSAKPERWSFSMLHKWNFLFPLGRNAQNIIVTVAVLLSIALMALLGLQMDLKRRARAARRDNH